MKTFVVYRHFSRSGELLYVGCTGNFLTRYFQHKAKALWFHEIKRITCEHYPTRRLALRVERDAIKAEHPKHNEQYNGEPQVRTSISISRNMMPKAARRSRQLGMNMSEYIRWLLARALSGAVAAIALFSLPIHAANPMSPSCVTNFTVTILSNTNLSYSLDCSGCVPNHDSAYTWSGTCIPASGTNCANQTGGCAFIVSDPTMQAGDPILVYSAACFNGHSYTGIAYWPTNECAVARVSFKTSCNNTDCGAGACVTCIAADPPPPDFVFPGGGGF